MSETTETKTRGERRELIGVVVSDKMDKTAVVLVERRFPHRLYKKFIRRRKHYYVHDPENTCRTGDQVRMVETRPLSRLKRWRLAEVLRRAK